MSLESGALAVSTLPLAAELYYDLNPNTNVAPTVARQQKLLSTNEPPDDDELAFIRSAASKTGACLAYVDDEIAQLRDRLGQLEEERASLSSYYVQKSVASIEPDARLEYLDSEIASRLRDRLRQLEEEHASLASYYTQNKGILSPLRRMPPEVLAEIFSWTLPWVHDAMGRWRFDAKSCPWVLTHICGRWRQVAISTPSLWSLIVINASRMSATPLSAVKTQIQRARTLKIHFYGEEGTDSRPQIEMWQFLVEYSAQWEELCVGLTSHLTPLLASLPGRIPSLRRLRIQWDGAESQASVNSIDCFQTAPRLVYASIYNRYRHVPILLPSHQLTRYYLDGPWETHERMLKLAPNLVVARIVVNFDEQDWPDPREILDVLCLQSLFVSHMDILQYLKVPALTELACYIDDDDDPDDLLHLDPFVVRSGCTLRRFAFAGSPDAQATGAILRQHPSVTQLAIMVEGHDNSDWPTLHDRANALISHLTIPGDATASAAISPQLSEISFGCKDHCSFDYSLHLQMLQSRWKVEGCTLKRAVLLIQSEPGPNAATVRGLDALREEGLDLFLGEGVEASDIMNDWMFYPRWVNYKY